MENKFLLWNIRPFFFVKFCWSFNYLVLVERCHAGFHKHVTQMFLCYFSTKRQCSFRNSLFDLRITALTMFLTLVYAWQRLSKSEIFNILFNSIYSLFCLLLLCITSWKICLICRLPFLIYDNFPLYFGNNFFCCSCIFNLKGFRNSQTAMIWVYITNSSVQLDKSSWVLIAHKSDLC